MARRSLRAMTITAATAGALVLGSTLAAVPASAHDRGPGRLAETLASSVAQGTITQAQADAILANVNADRTARQAKMEEFRTKAEPLIAAAHGLTVEQFRAAKEARTLTKLTAEQRTALQTKLDALAGELGISPTPRLGKGMGRDHGPGHGLLDGRGHHRGRG